MSLRKGLDQEPYRKQRPKHPDGWEPGYVDDGDAVTVAGESVGKPQPQAWRDMLEAEGFDPDEFEIKGELQVRKWQQRPDTRFVYYYRFTVVRRESTGWDGRALVSALVKRPPLRRKPEGGGHALVVCLSDWQAGADHGGGPEPLLERINALGPAVVQRWRDLRKMGVPLDRMYVHVMGDMGEGCNIAPDSTYTVHLNHEEQREFVVHGLDLLLDSWASLAPRISVYAVPGNHGEYRKSGKAFTGPRDNVDVGVVVSLAHAYGKNRGRYGHIQFHTPPGDELGMTYDHDGFVTGLIHGHQARGSGDAPKKIEAWWKSQAFGAQPIGDADLLITGHWHHYRVVQQGVKTHMMCPALCGSQTWWLNATGLDSPPGTLSYTVSKNGWSNAEVL